MLNNACKIQIYIHNFDNVWNDKCNSSLKKGLFWKPFHVYIKPQRTCTCVNSFQEQVLIDNLRTNYSSHSIKANYISIIIQLIFMIHVSYCYNLGNLHFLMMVSRCCRPWLITIWSKQGCNHYCIRLTCYKRHSLWHRDYRDLKVSNLIF